MIINTILIIAALAFGIYHLAPRISAHLAHAVKDYRRWQRYNKLCRIRKNRASRRLASVTSTISFTPGQLYEVPDVDNIVHYRSANGMTYISDVNSFNKTKHD